MAAPCYGTIHQHGIHTHLASRGVAGTKDTDLYPSQAWHIGIAIDGVHTEQILDRGVERSGGARPLNPHSLVGGRPCPSNAAWN